MQLLKTGSQTGSWFFHFANTTLAAIMRMNQSLMSYSFCQTGPFLNFRNPRFTYRNRVPSRPTNAKIPQLPWDLQRGRSNQESSLLALPSSALDCHTEGRTSLDTTYNNFKGLEQSSLNPITPPVGLFCYKMPS